MNSTKNPIATQFKKAAKKASERANDYILENEFDKAINATRIQLRALEAIKFAQRFDEKVRDLK